MDFPTSLYGPDPAVLERRVLVRPDGSVDSLRPTGRIANSGLLEFLAEKSGVYIAAIVTRPGLVTLDADKFNAYLVEDGLPHIYRLRVREGAVHQAARERYSKSPKALIRIGVRGEGDSSRVVGLPLEIVPLADPFSLRVGQTLRVRVLFQGVALGDANLGWDLPGDGDGVSGTVRTDQQGEALVPIARTGLMTIRLVHMTRPQAAAYEWESFWTTLTFRIAE
jgi:hypothetical protein